MADDTPIPQTYGTAPAGRVRQPCRYEQALREIREELERQRGEKLDAEPLIERINRVLD